MSKRKSDTDLIEKEIAKRFRLFEEKLLAKLTRRPGVLPVDSTSSESDDDSPDGRSQEETPSSPRRESSLQRRSSHRGQSSRRRASPAATSPQPRSPPPAAPSTSTMTVTAEVHQEDSTPVEKDNSVSVPDEVILDDDILQLLGDAPKAEVALGDPVHKDVASRWQHILSKGLTKELKEKLLQEYLVPSNCELLLSPTLNPEVKAAIPDTLVKRDTALFHKQKQLGIAITALASATHLILSKETSTQKILKPISDACRLLCDVHNAETKTRRNFIISSINTNLKDTLIESTRDKFLFGENVSEKIKAAKTIQRSGDALKNEVQKKIFSKSNFAYKNNNRNRLNSKPQHRKTENKSTSDNFRGRQTARVPPSSRNSGNKNDRSPVRKNQRRR